MVDEIRCKRIYGIERQTYELWSSELNLGEPERKSFWNRDSIWSQPQLLNIHFVISLVYFQLLKLIWRSERLLPAHRLFWLRKLWFHVFRLQAKLTDNSSDQFFLQSRFVSETVLIVVQCIVQECYRTIFKTKKYFIRQFTVQLKWVSLVSRAWPRKAKQKIRAVVKEHVEFLILISPKNLAFSPDETWNNF